MNPTQELIQYRQKSDYADYISFEKQKVHIGLEQARQFLDFVDSYCYLRDSYSLPK